MKLRTTPRPPSEQVAVAVEWRRMLGPGHQFATTNDRLLRCWRHPVRG